jgi:hypothetical protein
MPASSAAVIRARRRITGRMHALGFEEPDDLIAFCRDCHRDHHNALVLRAIRATEAAPLAVSVGDVLESVSGADP